MRSCWGRVCIALSPKTLRSSMGAAGRLPTLHSADLPAALAQLRSRGVTTLAAALYRSRPLDEGPGTTSHTRCLRGHRQ